MVAPGKLIRSPLICTAGAPQPPRPTPEPGVMPAGSVSVKATFVAWSVGLGFRIAIVKVEASFSGTVVGTNVLVIVGAVLITERLSKKPESVPGTPLIPKSTRVTPVLTPGGGAEWSRPDERTIDRS